MNGAGGAQAPAWGKRVIQEALRVAEVLCFGVAVVLGGLIVGWGSFQLLDLSVCASALPVAVAARWVRCRIPH